MLVKNVGRTNFGRKSFVKRNCSKNFGPEKKFDQRKLLVQKNKSKVRRTSQETSQKKKSKEQIRRTTRGTSQKSEEQVRRTSQMNKSEE